MSVTAIATPNTKSILADVDASSEQERYTIGVNRAIINKNCDPITGKKLLDYTQLTGNFDDALLTLDEIEAEVKQGHALCATFKNGYKLKCNFKSSGVVIMDFDSVTWAQIKKHPFVKKYAVLVYTSFSHQLGDNGDRFRIVFFLPAPVTSVIDYEAILNGIHDTKGLGEFADQAGRNVNQAMYGATNTRILLKKERSIPQALVDEWLRDAAQKRLIEEQAKAQRQAEAKARLEAMSKGQINLLSSELARALTFIPPRGSEGDGRYEECRNIVYAMLSVLDPDTALTILEAWSGDDDWDLEALVYDGRGDIHYEYVFERAKEHSKGQFKPDYRLFATPHDKPLTHKVNEYVCQKYLMGLPQVPQKLVCVKSGTNTGKTTALRKLIAESPVPVVIVYSTIALNAQISRDANVTYYQDVTDWARQQGHIAITMDSLHKLHSELYRGCHIVLDEPYPTIKRFMGQQKDFKRQAEVFRKFLGRASKITLLESGLTDNTINFIKELGAVDDDDTYILQNSYRAQLGTAYIYESPGQIRAKISEDIGAGATVAIGMDSGESGTGTMASYIGKEFPNKRVLVVNGDSDEELKARVVRDPEYLRDFDVFIFSPALFVGADITFSGEGHFNKVYGLKENDVLTPRDFQQALDRVRQIKDRELHVYIKPVWNNDKARAEDIYQEWLKNQTAYFNVIVWDALKDAEEFEQHYDGMMQVYSRIEAEDNLARRYFVENAKELLTGKGYRLELIPKAENESIYDDANETYREIRRETKRERKQAVLAARRLDDNEYELLSKAANKSRANRYEIERYQAVRVNGFSNDALELIVDTGVSKVYTYIERLEDMKLSDDELTDVQRHRNEKRGAHQRRDYIRANALRKELLAALGGLDTDAVLNELPEFMTVLRTRASEVKSVLGIKLTWNDLHVSGNDHKAAGKFLRSLGLKTSWKQRRCDGEKIRDYRIDPEHRAAILAIMERRVQYHIDKRAADEAEIAARAAELAEEDARVAGRLFDGVVSDDHFQRARQGETAQGYGFW